MICSFVGVYNIAYSTSQILPPQQHFAESNAVPNVQHLPAYMGHLELNSDFSPTTNSDTIIGPSKHDIAVKHWPFF